LAAVTHELLLITGILFGSDTHWYEWPLLKSVSYAKGFSLSYFLYTQIIHP